MVLQAQASPGQRFGVYLKRARTAAGMTQQEVAAKLGPGTGADNWKVSQWERGRQVVMPTPEAFHDLLDIVQGDAEEALRFIGYLEDGEEGDGREETAPSGEEVFIRLRREVDSATGVDDEILDVLRRAIDIAHRMDKLERHE